MNRISVIMGIYNCASTLPEAIESLINQTYQDWFLIMCDDGSSDDTYSIADNYRKRFPDKILLLKNEQNMGLNYTLNHCLKYADTEYVARMDGDDVSEPTRFEKEILFLDSHREFAIVSCPMIYFDENGEWGKGNSSGEPAISSIPKVTPFCHAPCMVRKEAYEKVGGYTVDKKYLRVEDYELWVKMISSGYRGFNLPECLYRMRDDRNATHRRRFVFRINEARVKIKAVKCLKLPFWNYIYAVRPILVGLCPVFLYTYFHKKQK